MELGHSGRNGPLLRRYVIGFICFAAVVKVTRAAGGAGVFAETEDGQSTVITNHGAVMIEHEQGHERKKEKEQELYDPKDWAIIKEELEEAQGHTINRRSLSRRKRFMSKNQFWPKGIVPFDFNMDDITQYYRDEARAAFTRWHKYTCIRFVPWVKDQTRQKYDLPDESHVTITKGSGCAAHQGNIRLKNRGQYNSCCGRYTCTHELGHTLGLWHEHQSPARGNITELIYSKVSADWLWTYRMRTGDLIVYQYDLSNTMHYGGSAFRILYEDLRPVIKMSNQYYMYKDVSLYHSCQELHCSNFTGECYNDAFVTVVDGKCSCLCPPGLDPSTGCATTLKQVTTSTVWPDGSYGLFSGENGCPSNGEFTNSSWEHAGKGDNSKSGEFHLAGLYTPAKIRHEFCVKNTSSPDAPAWESGRYCLLRVNGACPDGFQEGFIQFDDAPDTTGTSQGALPDGVFASDTRMEFCCRDDGFTSTPLLNLPNTQPLVLLMKSGSCQEIAGMRWTEEYMYIDSYPDAAETGGSVPYIRKKTKYRMYFCYYVPLDMNCGGEINLSNSNPKAVITSPNYPSPYGTNMECSWLIMAEEGAQVVLNFDDMKVTASGSTCKDSLEIRYNLPGQPGLRFCGDGIGRTIRSLNNTVIITLRTDHHMVAEDNGFNVTASLYVPEVDECYDPETRGALYTGQLNYSRGMRPCMHWSEVTNCPHHLYKPWSFGANLEKNYCRNPDNTAMPWCYVTKECQRDYCDVCNIERIFDKSTQCSTSLCNSSHEVIVASGCAGTCGIQPPPAPNREITCGEPNCIADADIVRSSGQTGPTYSVGDVVMYRCKTGNQTLNRTCLSDGKWSSGGYVCGACSMGWAYHNGSCFKWFPERVTFADAQAKCASYGAVVASQKNKEELEFTSRLRTSVFSMWIGATDIETEGSFVWQDGTPVTFTNWHPKNTPNNYRNQDCVEVDSSFASVWNDIRCSATMSFICQYPLSERQTCADFRSDCQNVLLDNPDTCSKYPDFVNQLCPFSCGLCHPDSTPACDVPATTEGTMLVNTSTGQTNATSVPRGAMVEYACQEGYVLTEGQQMLACGADGKLIGDLPVCKGWCLSTSASHLRYNTSIGSFTLGYFPIDASKNYARSLCAGEVLKCVRVYIPFIFTDPNTIVQESNDVELINRYHRTSSGYSYTSVGANLGITRTGVIKQWQFFSRTPGWTFFQVWRPNPQDADRFSLVGQNQIMTAGQGRETQNVQEADWIHVQPGDMLGILELGNPRGSVPYDYCDNNKSPGGYPVRYSKHYKGYGDFSPVLETEFSTYVSCRIFSFRAVIYPEDSVPAKHKLPTNQLPLINRNRVGSRDSIYIGDSENYYIPADGVVSEWQLYVRGAGVTKLQVWRHSKVEGTRMFEFIGENSLNVTNDTEHLHTFTVPEGERIAVLKRDIVGIEYGNPSTMLRVPYSHCSSSSYPESGNVYWLDTQTLEPGTSYGFSYTGGWLCRMFCFRAIVTQTAG